MSPVFVGTAVPEQADVLRSMLIATLMVAVSILIPSAAVAVKHLREADGRKITVACTSTEQDVIGATERCGKCLAVGGDGLA